MVYTSPTPAYPSSSPSRIPLSPLSPNSSPTKRQSKKIARGTGQDTNTDEYRDYKATAQTPPTLLSNEATPAPPSAPSTASTPSTHPRPTRPRVSRTAAASQVKTWLQTSLLLAARAKSLTSDLKAVQSKYVSEGGTVRVNPVHGGRGSKVPANATTGMKKGASEADSRWYRSEIGLLRKYTETAVGALKDIASVGDNMLDMDAKNNPKGCKNAMEVDKKIRGSNSVCDSAVRSYEATVSVVLERMRGDYSVFDAEIRNTMAYLDNCEAKFERWVSNSGGEEHSELEEIRGHAMASPNIVSIPHTTEAVEMTDFGAREGDVDNDASFYNTKENEHDDDCSVDSDLETEIRIDRVKNDLSRHPDRKLDFKGMASKIDSQINKDGGKSGAGWHKDEHAQFLKAWTRCDGDLDRIVRAVRDLGAVLSRKSDDVIVGHAGWYSEFLQRCRTKKELAGMWRKQKEEEREELLRKHEEEMDNREKEKVPGVSKETREKVELAEREKKEAIRRWRASKLKEERAKEDKEEEKQEGERLRWEKMQEKHVFLRAKVNEYKGQKEERKERDGQIKELIKKSERNDYKLSREDVERRRDREIKDAREKRERREREERGKEEEAARLRGIRSAGVGHVTRDFGRLTGETAAAKARAWTSEELDDYDSVKKGRSAHDKPVYFSGRDLGWGGGAGKRATPSWRQGV